MSDVAYQPRVKNARARTLGDAVPTFRPFRDDSADVKIVPKTSEELRAESAARRDGAAMTTSCAVDGCDWTHEGTAGECRERSAAHRGTAHPELAGRRTHRKGISFKRRGEEVDPATVAESRRLRQEKDDRQRIDTINRGRALRGEDPILTEETTMPTCKIDGCDNDASDAPKAGPTAKLCKTHRGERSATLSLARTGKPRGAAGGGAGDPAPPEPKPIVVPPAPIPDGGDLAALARELEDARVDVNRANTRWLDAVRAFKAHDVIRSIGDEGDVAA